MHDPEERFQARPIESDKGDSWVLVRPAEGPPGAWEVGMSPDQARDLAKSLVTAAFDAEMIDRRIEAGQPVVVTAGPLDDGA